MIRCILTLALGGLLPACAAGNPALVPEGPLAVTIDSRSSQGNRSYAAHLLYLRPDRIGFRHGQAGTLVIREAARSNIVRVRSGDGKLEWTYDPIRQEFRGPRLRVVPVDLSPDSRGKRDERECLFQALQEAFADVDALDALEEGDDSAPLRAALRGYADHIRKNALGTELARCSDAIAQLIERREETHRRLRDINWKTLARKATAQTNLTAAYASSRRLLSALDAAEILRDQRGVWSGANSEDLFSTVVLSLGALGLRGHMQNMRRQELDQEYERLQFRELSRITEEGVRLWARAWAEFLDARYKTRTQLHAAGERLFHLADVGKAQKADAALAGYVRKGAYRLAAEHHADLLKADPDNPFLQARHCYFSALVPEGDRLAWSIRALGLARTAAGGVRRLPEGPLFDRSRQTILVTACRIASLAADLETGTERWSGSYSAAAAYTVRLVDAFLKIKPDHEWRSWMLEQRAWALMRSERPADALTQALAVAQRRRGSPTFGVNLARIYATRGEKGDTERAMKWLEHAVRVAGYRNIRHLRTNPDFDALGGAQRRAFSTLTRVSFACAADPRSAGVRIVNHSPFDLTNVTVTARYLNNGRWVKSTSPLPLLCIPPKGEVLIPGLLKGADPRAPWRCYVQADQSPK